MPWKYNGRVIQVGKSWTDDRGVTHPSNWNVWDDATRASVGVVWEEPPASYDLRFYLADGTPKDLDGLKAEWTMETKRHAHDIISPTNWLLLRSLTNPLDVIPPSVSQYHNAVRGRSNSIETLIQSCQTHAEFVALFDTPTDADGIPTGHAPINNWPENTVQEYER